MPTLKERMNRALWNRFGYHLQKGPPGLALQNAQDREAALLRQLDLAERRASEAELRALRAEENLDRRRPTVRARLESLAEVPVFGIDAAAAEIISAVRPNTRADAVSVAALVDAVRYIVRDEIGGAIVDCGVEDGGAIQAVARALLEAGDKERDLFLVDAVGAQPSAGAQVSELIESTSYPLDRFHYLTSDGRQPVWTALPSTIALCRVAAEDYAQADLELHQLWDLVAPNGVLVIDGFDRGAAAAQVMDDLVNRTAEPLFFVRAGSSHIAVRSLL
jgi:hypothetical protein